MFALRRVRDHIDRNSARDLTLSDLAALAGVSRFPPSGGDLGGRAAAGLWTTPDCG